MASLNDESQSLLAAARAAGTTNNPISNDPSSSASASAASGQSGTLSKSVTSSAATSNDPRFKLLEINPAGNEQNQFVKKLIF